MVHLAPLNLDRLTRAVPLWMPFSLVSVLAATLWGILTVLGSGALEAVPENLRPAVATLAAAGNLMTALAALAFWPVITAAFFSMGVLLDAPRCPEFRDLACGIGLAHMPAALGILIVWILVVAGGGAAFPAGSGIGTPRTIVVSAPLQAVCRAAALSGYLVSLLAFVLVVRGLFRTSWLRAAAIVAVPLAVYSIAASVIRRALD
jgi:hypothetical protein